MGRLSMGTKDAIVERLIDPKKKQIRKAAEEIERYVDDLCLLQTPEKVRSLGREKRSLIAYNSSFWIGERYRWNKSKELNCLYLKDYIPVLHEKMIIDLKYIKEFDSLTVRHKKLIEDFVKLKNKLICALEHINKENQLKNQFPEAYKAYSSIMNAPLEKDQEESPCDSIESVRALLSKQ